MSTREKLIKARLGMLALAEQLRWILGLTAIQFDDILRLHNGR